MTVKELIETNACIVEAYITLRGDYFGKDFRESVYVHEFGIGSCASFGNQVDSSRQDYGRGTRGSKFPKPYTLINKEINSRGKHDYWCVITKVFPQSVLDLEVTSWSMTSAYMWGRILRNSTGYESACIIRIECWLPPEHVKEIRVESEVKEIPQLAGQLSFTDFPEVMP